MYIKGYFLILTLCGEALEKFVLLRVLSSLSYILLSVIVNLIVFGLDIFLEVG